MNFFERVWHRGEDLDDEDDHEDLFDVPHSIYLGGVVPWA